jgi:hypothetical protein
VTLENDMGRKGQQQKCRANEAFYRERASDIIAFQV